jgi:hypothetical protein
MSVICGWGLTFQTTGRRVVSMATVLNEMTSPARSWNGPSAIQVGRRGEEQKRILYISYIKCNRISILRRLGMSGCDGMHGQCCWRLDVADKVHSKLAPLSITHHRNTYSIALQKNCGRRPRFLPTSPLATTVREIDLKSRWRR